MKKHWFYAWLYTLLVLCVSSSGSVLFGGELSQPLSPRNEPIVLFNGKDVKDLSKFYTWLSDTKQKDPRQVFTVTKEPDGTPVIRVSGDGYGGIITKQEYTNYHLICEFRWGKLTWGRRKTRTKDSGILLHCVGTAGNANKAGNSPWMASIECQIIEGGVGDFIVVGGFDKQGQRFDVGITAEVTKDRDGESVWKKGGTKQRFPGGRVNWFGRDPDWKDVLGFRGKNDVESPGMQWTCVESLCDGGNLTYIVNGVVVNAATAATPTAGKLLFQTEGAEIYFRKIELHPLKKH